MSESSQSAEQIAIIAVKLTEMAARLSADGLKNLAALFLALAQKPKSHGATSVYKLFQDGSVPQVFQIKPEDLKKFKEAAKEYGVLFSAIKHKDGDRDIDILVRMQDTPKINRILEKFGYGEPTWNLGNGQSEKKKESLDRSERQSNTPNNTSKKQEQDFEEIDDKEGISLSTETPVRERVESAKKIVKGADEMIKAAIKAVKHKADFSEPPTNMTER